MKEVRDCMTTGSLIWYMLELRGRQVCQQDLTLPGGFSANVFQEIANG